MKKFLIIGALVMGAAFAQQRFSAGAFYGDVSVVTQTNTLVLLGSLPAGSVLTGIVVGQAVQATNVVCTNYLNVGIQSLSNYFLSAAQLLLAGNISRPTAISNAFAVQSSTGATRVYAWVSRTGALDTAVGTYRVLVQFCQK